MWGVSQELRKPDAGGEEQLSSPQPSRGDTRVTPAVWRMSYGNGLPAPTQADEAHMGWSPEASYRIPCSGEVSGKFRLCGCRRQDLDQAQGSMECPILLVAGRVVCSERRCADAESVANQSKARLHITQGKPFRCGEVNP